MRAGTACRSNRTRTAASAIFIWRPGAGQQTVDFQNSRDHGGELVTIENPIFKTAYVGPALTLVSINGHHSAYLQNCVGYGNRSGGADNILYVRRRVRAAGSRVVLHAEPGSVGHDRVQRRRRRILLLHSGQTGIADGELQGDRDRSRRGYDDPGRYSCTMTIRMCTLR